MNNTYIFETSSSNAFWVRVDAETNGDAWDQFLIKMKQLEAMNVIVPQPVEWNISSVYENTIANIRN